MQAVTQPEQKSFQSEGLTLNYLDWGNPGAPLLILSHGMQDHARSWDWVARDLCADWHVVAPDLRGHGDSDWSPDGAYHTPYYLLDLCRLIDALGADEVSIVAHSLGGNAAARFAGLYPQRVKNLVLVDAMGPTAPVLEHWDQQGVVNRTRDWLEKRRAMAARAPRTFTTIEDAAARMRKANPQLSETQALYLTEHGLRHTDHGYTWKYDPRAGNFHPEDFAIHLSEYWRRISARTLICWGPESWTSNPAEDGNAAYFQHGQTRTFDGAGHWIHHDKLDEFVSAVTEFLKNNQ